MPWEKSFNVLHALDCAMQEFWSSGYKQASIAAICNAIPASRYGLYDEFGDKHKLYLLALDRYSDSVMTAILAPMQQENAGLAELAQYRDRLLSNRQGEQAKKGCFMCVAAMEMALTDEAVAKRVAAHFQRQRSAFLNCLNNAVDQLDRAPDELADMLVLAIQGAALMMRAGVSRREVNRQLKSTFDLIL